MKVSINQAELDRLRRKNADLRTALKASVAANAMYEVLEQAYQELLQAGRNWTSGIDVYGPCGACGECSTCELATLIDEALPSPVAGSEDERNIR